MTTTEAVSTTVLTTTATTTEAKTTAASTATAATTTAATAKSTTAATTKKTTTRKATPTEALPSCYLTVECSAALDNIDKLKEGHAEFVPSDGIIISETKCTFTENDTVYDILKKVCKNKGIKLTARDTVYGIYVSGINNLDEFDCGSASGWVYTVNSKSPSVSCGKYEVSNGDEIIFKYVC
jgi:hypothetical protein